MSAAWDAGFSRLIHRSARLENAVGEKISPILIARRTRSTTRTRSKIRTELAPRLDAWEGGSSRRNGESSEARRIFQRNCRGDTRKP